MCHVRRPSTFGSMSHWPSLPIARPLITTTALCLFAVLPALAQFDCQSSKGHVHGNALRDGGTGIFWPMDVLHQRIFLDLTPQGSIVARCEIDATPRQAALDHFPLHLAALTVDSVTLEDLSLPFSHVDELLDIDLPAPLDLGDTVRITVHYHGVPAVDPSGFGGWYNTGTYIYNLGVAFTSVPHSYGRAWFPCVDNFTERSSYEFIVRTHAGRNAWCNGELLSETTLGGDTLERHWRIEETMPAYLASVAASNYVSVRDTFPSLGAAPVPVVLVARPPDTTNMKNSFINLQQAFDHFEEWFGPYRWNKVGYVLTPLGAMEHSTSIHYPQFIANGNLQYEHVMAHELAHQWWGNLVTCDKAEEMYINEGFSEYLSYLFQEAVYGTGRYRNVVRANHRKMVHRAHLIDEGWWALADVPQEFTYGEHSYNKGADVIHTLRGYLGDELFKQGLTSFLEEHAFRSVNSELLRDHLTQSTGVDMTGFFNDWIFQPGWAAFEVDSFQVQPLGNDHEVTVYVEQKQRGPAAPYNNVPLQVTLLDADGTPWRAPDSVFVGGPLSSFTVAAPFAPSTVILNENERISQAVTVDVDTLVQAGWPTYAHADLRLNVVSLPGPLPIRMEEYWVAADAEVDEAFAYRISPDRWWRVVASIPEEAVVHGRIIFDGRPTTGGSLDLGLMQDLDGLPFHEDSLVLLYRPDQRSAWTLHPSFTVNTLNSPTDKFGRLDFNDLRAGEYTLAWRTSAVGVQEPNAASAPWSISPNPARDHVMITCHSAERLEGEVHLLDDQGRLLYAQRWQGSPQHVPVNGQAAGIYLLRFMHRDGRSTPIGKVVLER
jgi:hypothetical protein